MDYYANNQTGEGGGAWALSRLGSAIDSYVDRELNKPTVIANSGGFGIDERGELYSLGQPARGAVVTAGRPINPTFLLLILAGVFFAVQK